MRVCVGMCVSMLYTDRKRFSISLPNAKHNPWLHIAYFSFHFDLSIFTPTSSLAIITQSQRVRKRENVKLFFKRNFFISSLPQHHLLRLFISVKYLIVTRFEAQTHTHTHAEMYGMRKQNVKITLPRARQSCSITNIENRNSHKTSLKEKKAIIKRICWVAALA